MEEGKRITEEMKGTAREVVNLGEKDKGQENRARGRGASGGVGRSKYRLVV